MMVGFSLKYAAARAWTKWEMMTAHLLPNEDTVKRGDDDEFFLAFARIENHYFVNKGFFPSDSYLFDNIEKIKHINTVVVQFGSVGILISLFVYLFVVQLLDELVTTHWPVAPGSRALRCAGDAPSVAAFVFAGV